MKSSGFEVGVEEGHLAAQFTQPEPGAHEVGLVPHPKRDNVTVFHTDLAPENVRKLVAPYVHIHVRQNLLLENDERLLGTLLCLVNEAV